MPIFLATADLHLTERHQDEYRWSIFKTLRREIAAVKPDALMLLGDLTDEKDRHSSVLVNRLVDEIKRTAELTPVHILKGNHDYIDEANPFFDFLQDLKSVNYYRHPTRWDNLFTATVVFLPHAKHP